METKRVEDTRSSARRGEFTWFDKIFKVDPHYPRIAKDDRRQRHVGKHGDRGDEQARPMGKKPLEQEVERHQNHDGEEVTEIHGTEPEPLFASKREIAHRTGTIHRKKSIEDPSCPASWTALQEHPGCPGVFWQDRNRWIHGYFGVRLNRHRVTLLSSSV